MVWTIHKKESRLYHASQTPFNAENATLFQCMETFDKQSLCLIFKLKIDLKIEIKYVVVLRSVNLAVKRRPRVTICRCPLGPTKSLGFGS